MQRLAALLLTLALLALSGTAGVAQEVEDGDEVIQPVGDDDTAPVLPEGDEVPAEHSDDDDSAPVLPGEDDTPPLQPVTETEQSGEADQPVSVAVPAVSAEKIARVTGGILVLKLAPRQDGSAPSIEIRPSPDGKDALIWVDGRLVVVVKGRPDFTSRDLRVELLAA